MQHSPKGPVDAPVEDARLRSTAVSAFPDVLSLGRSLLVSMRPRQWPKNLLVLAAFLFSVNLAWEPSDPSSWLPLLGRASAAFAIFCLISGAAYLINDVHDAEADRLHPRKRLRPIAAGTLDPGLALGAATTFIAIGLAASFVLDARFGLVVVTYMVLMFAYSYVTNRAVEVDLRSPTVRIRVDGKPAVDGAAAAALLQESRGRLRYGPADTLTWRSGESDAAARAAAVKNVLRRLAGTC